MLPPLATHVGWQAALCIAASVALVAIALFIRCDELWMTTGAQLSHFQ